MPYLAILSGCEAPNSSSDSLMRCPLNSQGRHDAPHGPGKPPHTSMHREHLSNTWETVTICSLPLPALITTAEMKFYCYILLIPGSDYVKQHIVCPYIVNKCNEQINDLMCLNFKQLLWLFFGERLKRNAQIQSVMLKTTTQASHVDAVIDSHVIVRRLQIQPSIA